MPTPSVITANVTTRAPIPGTTSTTTTVLSNASAGIPMPSSVSSPTSLPTNASTEASMPGSISAATTVSANASEGIPMTSCASTPTLWPTNASTGASIPGTISITTAMPSNAPAGIPMPSSASTPTSSPPNASTGASIPGTTSTTTAVPFNASAGSPMTSSASTTSVMPTNVSAGTSMPTTVPVGVAATTPSAPGLLAYNDLPQEEINRHLNIYASQVLIPICFRKILEWGCHKKQTDTFYTYLTNDKMLTHTQLKKIYKISGEDDLNKLKNVEPSLMDGPLLCKVIQAACEELQDTSDDVWKENDKGKTECLIIMLKECRNKVCHEIKTAAISSNMFKEIICLLEELIRVGGMLYQKDSTEIDEELQQLRENIEFVRTTKSERELIALQHLFHTTGYSEMESYWKKYCAQDINLFSNQLTTHTDVFYPLNVLQKSSSTHNRPMSYQKMFDVTLVDDDRPVLILQGEAGSGKSTILKQIAMQFFKLIKDRMPSLEEFHLLHFLQCNNQKFNDLSDFIKSFFHETCKIVSPEDALRCFPYLGNLILIDGYDEVNTHSIRVTKQIIEAKKNNPACQIVFTARPCAIPNLEDLLKREGVQFSLYELLEISQEKHQLEFLRRLDADPCMCRAFSALSSDVKSFFVRPINLVQFYTLFENSPEKVSQWKSINDVMQDIMLQYVALITFKLEHRGIQDLNIFIEEVLQRLGDFAFEGLMKRMFTLDKRACDKLRDYCLEIIEKWRCNGVVSTTDILSVVFVTKVIPTNDAVPTYQYFHKSIQELMSTRSLLRDFTLDPNMTLEDLIRTKLQSMKEIYGDILNYDDIMDGLLSVFKFVLMIFSHPDKRAYLLRWLPQLETALTHAKADWQDVMMSCDRPANTEQDEVAKIAAREKLIASKYWEALTARDVMAIARMLPHAQPDALDVQLPESEGTPSELATVLKMFTGPLKLNICHSHETYTNCEHIVDELKSSCSVTSFTGCLASSSVSTRKLAVTLKQPGTRLDLTLDNPSLHSLRELQGTDHILNVRIKQHNSPTARPLPRGLVPPLLKVEGTPDSGAEELRAAILHYAPEGGVYFSLWLENTVLDDAAIQRLLPVLHEDGIRTSYHRGETCYTVAGISSDGICLHCHKTHIDASQRCVWLQLADEGKEEGGEEFTMAPESKPIIGVALAAEVSCVHGDGRKLQEPGRNKETPRPLAQPHSTGAPEGGQLLTSHLNSYAVHSILTSIFQIILQWGCPKLISESYIEFLGTNFSVNRKLSRSFTIAQMEMLNEVECTKFDVTMAYRCIPFLCPNIEPAGAKIWYEEEKKHLEYLLKHANDIKNKIAHSPRGGACIGRPELEELAVMLLMRAGERFSVEDDVVEAKVSAFTKKIYQLWPGQRGFNAVTALGQDRKQDNSKLTSFNGMMRFITQQVLQMASPDIVGKVIDWGCRKPLDMTFWDYASKLGDKHTIRNLKSEQRGLQTGNHIDFDFYLLYKLIPVVCENLHFSGINPREKASCSTVEGLLMKIKDARNEIVHSAPGTEVPSDNLRYLEDLFTKLVIATGKLYAVDRISVGKEVTAARFKVFKVIDECFMYSPAAQDQ